MTWLLLNTIPTRWYLRDIQKLGFTYELPETPGGGVILGQSKLKVPSPGQISMGRGGEVFWGTEQGAYRDF